MRRVVLSAIALTLAACQNSKPLAEQHLEALKAGETAKAQAQLCVPGDSLLLHSVKSYEVVSTNEASRDGRSFAEVVANVQSDQVRMDGVNRVPITQVKIEVWEPDTFYDQLLATNAQLNELGKRTEALTGIPQPSLENPPRDSVSQSKECVSLPYDQFQDK